MIRPWLLAVVLQLLMVMVMIRRMLCEQFLRRVVQLITVGALICVLSALKHLLMLRPWLLAVVLQLLMVMIRRMFNVQLLRRVVQLIRVRAQICVLSALRHLLPLRPWLLAVVLQSLMV